jgi:hypothetical protein
MKTFIKFLVMVFIAAFAVWALAVSVTGIGAIAYSIVSQF